MLIAKGQEAQEAKLCDQLKRFLFQALRQKESCHQNNVKNYSEY